MKKIIILIFCYMCRPTYVIGQSFSYHYYHKYKIHIALPFESKIDTTYIYTSTFNLNTEKNNTVKLAIRRISGAKDDIENSSVKDSFFKVMTFYKNKKEHYLSEDYPENKFLYFFGYSSGIRSDNDLRFIVFKFLVNNNIYTLQISCLDKYFDKNKDIIMSIANSVYFEN